MAKIKTTTTIIIIIEREVGREGWKGRWKGQDKK